MEDFSQANGGQVIEDEAVHSKLAIFQWRPCRWLEPHRGRLSSADDRSLLPGAVKMRTDREISGVS